MVVVVLVVVSLFSDEWRTCCWWLDMSGNASAVAWSEDAERTLSFLQTCNIATNSMAMSATHQIQQIN
jgi:hypothetical protein